MWGGCDPFWYRPWGYWYEQTIVEECVEGTLIIDLLNLPDKNLDNARGQLKKELDKAFKEFPPSEKGKAEKRRERQRLSSK